MYLIPGIIFFVLFGIFSILHLYYSYKENLRGRIFTKPFCMLFLGIGTACLIPNYPLVYVGTFCGCIGDVFLLDKKRNASFLIGTLFFAVGHACYLSQMIQTLPYQIEGVMYFVFIAVYILLILIIYLLTRKKLGIKSIFVALYMSFLLVVVIIAGFYMGAIINNHLSSALLIFIGYLVFLSSDSIICYTNFVKNVKRSHVYTMSTYLVAQFCIILGFVLLFM